MEKYPRATQIALRSVGILYLMVWCVFWHISVTGASEVQRNSTGGCRWSHTGSSCCKSLVRCLRYLFLPDTFCGIISVFYFISYVSDLAALLHPGLPCSTSCMRAAWPPPSASGFLIVFGMFRWFWCYLVLSIHCYNSTETAKSAKQGPREIPHYSRTDVVCCRQEELVEEEDTEMGID